MSKKKEKVKKDAPMDYQLATKNLQYTIVVKDTDLERLKNDNNNKNKYILSLEEEISKLKSGYINAYDLDIKLRKALTKNENLQKKVDNFNNYLLEVQKKNEEEKKDMENSFQSQINHLQLTIQAYNEKVKLTNQLLIDKEKLEKDLKQANNENKEIIKKKNEALTTIKIKNEIKYTNLKNKMTENILKSKSKVSDLNLQYMDVASKLVLLQNHQLLIQLEYQTQQIDELKEKNKSLEKKIYDLSREIDIHKKVELSLAEKNKTFNIKTERSKQKKFGAKSYVVGFGKNKKISKSNSNNNFNSSSIIKIENINTESIDFNEENKELDDKVYRKTISFKNIKNKNIKSNIYSIINNSNKSLLNSNIFNSKNNNGSSNFKTSEQSRIIYLENKVINLEKKLISIEKDYNNLQDKNEFTKRILQNYENKYSGLFNFLEECLNKFYNDEELKNNKEIYANIDSIQKGDFTLLSKEEKYSTLIILMKYLIPLINNKNIENGNNKIDNINLKFCELNEPKKLTYFINKKNKKIKRQYIINTTNNFYNFDKKVDTDINKTLKNEFNPFPSIKNLSLIGSRLVINKSLSKNKAKEYNNKLK